MIRVAVLLVGLAAAAVAGSGARAGPSGSRAIDRTFLCQTNLLGGIYQVTMQASFGTPPGTRKRVFSLMVTAPDAFLGGMDTHSIWVNRERCHATAGGRFGVSELRGGQVGPLGRKLWCETPHRMLIRVHGVFENPTSLRATTAFNVSQLRAVGTVDRAGLSIATPTGKPIAHASFSGFREARLLTSTACREG